MKGQRWKESRERKSERARERERSPRKQRAAFRLGAERRERERETTKIHERGHERSAHSDGASVGRG